MNSSKVKLVVFVPLSHADSVREALGTAGAGTIGNYEFCSFSVRGIGRFRGNATSNPTIGTPDVYETVEEERIEVVVPRDMLSVVIEAMRKTHPYEEIAFDVYPLEDSPPDLS